MQHTDGRTGGRYTVSRVRRSGIPSRPQLTQTEAEVAATWQDVMDPVTMTPVQFSDNTAASIATPQSSSNNTLTSPNGKINSIGMMVNAASHIGNGLVGITGDAGANPGRATGREACAEGSAGSTTSSLTTSATGAVSNGSRTEAWVLPEPLEVKPGVAAESALRGLRAYVRRLRITKGIEAEAEK